MNRTSRHSTFISGSSDSNSSDGVLRTWGLGLLAMAALALTCWAYLSPALMLDLANQLWACF
jgi:MYXO-CTERM domain-containing protein